jgi:hypothetical protein
MRKVIASLFVAGALLFTGTTLAAADPPVGNSGHSSNGSTQCKAGSVDHCPPFGG